MVMHQAGCDVAVLRARIKVQLRHNESYLMKRLSLPLSTPFRRAALAVVLVALVLPGVCSDSAAAGQNDAHGRRVDKLDANLRHALDHEGDWQSRRVIVRVDPNAIGSV